MENKLFGAYELSTINNERLEYIKQYALYEYQVYMEKIINSPLSITTVIKTASEHRNKRNSYSIPNDYVNLATQTLENYMKYKASAKTIPLNSDVEKIFFMGCGIFPNDEKFLNTLTEHNFLNIFTEFIEIYFYIDEKYKTNEILSNMQKYMQYTKFIKNNKDKLTELKNYFSKFHRITDINLIINKLLQIHYFNPELYNSYVETNEDEKTNQKVKIG